MKDEGPTGLRVFDPPYPTTHTEYITILAHYHRAEIARMAGWRDRIDRTTNWAITVVAAMLSLSFSTQTSHHSVLLFGMMLMFLLVSIESRRYRFFDVYRRRVRAMERNYYALVFNPALVAPPHWARMLGEDLQRPAFLITHRRALSRRLHRNYIWMFLLLLVAWVLKVFDTTASTIGRAPGSQDSPRTWYAGADIGFIPGWLVLIVVVGFYGWLIYTAYFTYRVRDDDDGSVHV